MKSTKDPKPNIRIPAKYKRYRRLVGVPESKYRQIEALSDSHQPKTFTKRSLKTVQKELVAAYPDEPELMADIIRGLRQSSPYA